MLCPLLFLLHINDLPNVSNKLSFYLFADNTNIFFESDNLGTLQKIVNHELKKLVMWLNANSLALNVSKTNFIIFSAVNKPLKTVTILINRLVIGQEFIKYLGVLIDSKLTFKQRISSVSKTNSRTIGLIYKLRQYVSKMIYYSLNLPVLIYVIPIWGNVNLTFLNSIQILQKSNHFYCWTA